MASGRLFNFRHSIFLTCFGNISKVIEIKRKHEPRCNKFSGRNIVTRIAELSTIVLLAMFSSQTKQNCGHKELPHVYMLQLRHAFFLVGNFSFLRKKYRRKASALAFSHTKCNRGAWLNSTCGFPKDSS